MACQNLPKAIIDSSDECCWIDPCWFYFIIISFIPQCILDSSFVITGYIGKNARSQRYETMYSLSVVVLILGKGVVDLSWALRVPNQRHFRFPCNLYYSIYASWYIVRSHVSPSTILNRSTRIPLIRFTVCSASIIANPDIVASLGKLPEKVGTQKAVKVKVQ